MMHVRKTLSKQEVRDYEKWKEKHDSAIAAHKPTKAERDARASKFWQEQNRAINDRMAARGDHRTIPSLPPQKPEEPKRDPLLDMEPEEREAYLARERAAQEEIALKKSRTGPMYNKGGDQYWTEEMLNDLKGGGHRRR